MTPKAKGSYFGPKHLEQTTLGHTHFIENAHAKPRQHYKSIYVKLGVVCTAKQLILVVPGE